MRPTLLAFAGFLALVAVAGCKKHSDGAPAANTAAAATPATTTPTTQQTTTPAAPPEAGVIPTVDAAAANGKMPATVMLSAIKTAGAMTGVAHACGFGGDDAVDKARSNGRDTFAQNGISTADFDKAFDAGLAEANAKFATASAAEKARGCEQMKMMASPEMQAKLQKMRDQTSQMTREHK